MKKRRFKLLPIIGLLFAAASFVFVIKALFATPEENQIINGNPPWVFGVILSIASMFFYILDAVVLFAEGHKGLYFVLAIAVMVGIAIGMLFGSDIVLWDIYFLLLSIAELLSLCLKPKEEKNEAL